MKNKCILLLLIVLTKTLNAQSWGGSTPGDIYYNLGSIGIGTTTPYAKLHIPNGNAIIGGSTFVNPVNLNSSLVVISRDNNSTTYPFYVGQPAGSDLFWLRGNGNAYLLGRLGFGTSTPNAKLHIPNGNAIIGGDASLNPVNLNSSLVVVSRDNNSTTFPLYVGQPAGADLFWIRGNGNGYFMGNLGIGTTTRDSKLTVNGKIKAEEIEVVVDVPADYVFDPAYKLMALSEVSAYIKKNKHLPNIPSAEELKRDGWQVGEMNNKLLEKVEELTLYILQLKEENNKLNERVRALEKKK